MPGPITVLVGIYGEVHAWTIPAEEVARLRSRFPSVVFTHVTDDDTLRTQAADADVAFSWKIDRAVFARARRLQWIHTPAAGVGSMLTPELAASDVVVTNSRGVHAVPIAEHVIAVSIALLRRMPEAWRCQMERRWAQNELADPPPRMLRGLRMGVVGLGAIGTEVARLASALGVRVIGVRRRSQLPPPPGVERVFAPERLPDVLAEADIVVLAAPLTQDTWGVMDGRALSRMKPGALLVNVGRGKLVDEAALVEALRAGTIAGAALDVVAHEPLDAGSPLWEAPNLLITPHTSGVRADYWPVVTDLFAENLDRFLAGRPLRNVVDKAAGY